MANVGYKALATSHGLPHTAPRSTTLFPKGLGDDDSRPRFNSQRRRAESLPTRPLIQKEIVIMPPIDDIPEIPDEDETPASSQPPRPEPLHQTRISTSPAISVIHTAPITQRGAPSPRRKTRDLVRTYRCGYVGIRPSKLSPRTLATVPENGELVTITKRERTVNRAPTPPPLPRPRSYTSPRLPRGLRGDVENSS